MTDELIVLVQYGLSGFSSNFCPHRVQPLDRTFTSPGVILQKLGEGMRSSEEEKTQRNYFWETVPPRKNVGNDGVRSSHSPLKPSKAILQASAFALCLVFPAPLPASILSTMFGELISALNVTTQERSYSRGPRDCKNNTGWVFFPKELTTGPPPLITCYSKKNIAFFVFSINISQYLTIKTAPRAPTIDACSKSKHST